MRVSVIGAGSWGTTVASMVAAKVETVVWARREEVAEAVNERRETGCGAPPPSVRVPMRRPRRRSRWWRS